MAAATYREFQSITIDFEVFKALTALLDSPADDYNAVLRRVLRLEPLESKQHPTQITSDPGGDWSIGGARFPEGTQFRARYKGEYYNAEVTEAALLYEGERYSSPSAAAIAVTGNSVNGWRFWDCKLPGRGWVAIDSLRN